MVLCTFACLFTPLNKASDLCCLKPLYCTVVMHDAAWLQSSMLCLCPFWWTRTYFKMCVNYVSTFTAFSKVRLNQKHVIDVKNCCWTVIFVRDISSLSYDTKPGSCATSCSEVLCDHVCERHCTNIDQKYQYSCNVRVQVLSVAQWRQEFCFCLLKKLLHCFCGQKVSHKQEDCIRLWPFLREEVWTAVIPPTTLLYRVIYENGLCSRLGVIRPILVSTSTRAATDGKKYIYIIDKFW